MATEMTAEEYCKIMTQWLRQVQEQVARDGDEADPNFIAIAKVAPQLTTAIAKSSYLGRRLYGGEAQRTQMCPKHQGRWHGLPSLHKDCEYGCDLTGWLPVTNHERQ